MNKRIGKFAGGIIVSGLLIASLAGCGIRISTGSSSQASSETAAAAVQEETGAFENEVTTIGSESQAVSEENAKAVTTVANATSTGAIDASELFTDRDLRQSADLSEAVYYEVSDGDEILITSEGVYVISGTASNATIIVDADSEDKVQIVLDGVSITNDDFPAIYVKSADKVFITTTETENSLSVTGTFRSDGDTSTDAVIFSKDDLVFNGLGTLTIVSTDNGISGKDDIKITGGTLDITSEGDSIEAHDSIAVADGNITINSKNDGIQAKDSDDDATGYVYICGGTFNITAADDGIHGTTIVQIDDGDITISASEGIEGTYIQINGGTISISASDDGINAANKSGAYSTLAEFNGGYITIVMGSGDTDGVDSNGNLIINGGTIDVTAQSPFDYDGTAQYNGGTIIVNGEETNSITNQFGGGMGGFGGNGGFGGGTGFGGNGGFGGFGGGGRP